MALSQPIFLVLALAIVGVPMGFLMGWRRRGVRLARAVARRDEAERNQRRYHQKMLQLDIWMRQLMMSAGREDQFQSMSVAGALDLVDADRALLLVLDPRGGLFRIATSAGAQETPSDATHAFAAGDAVAWVAEHGEALVIDGTTPAGKPLPGPLQSPGQSTLLAPITDGDHVVALLVACRNADAFDPIDRQTMLVFAQKVSIAGENMRLVVSLGEEKERAEVTLHSIGDAVITTDSNGLVDYLNPVAETLTGWTNLEAAGVAIEQIFHVIDEQTRERIDNPALTSLREGAVASAGSSTSLIRRDGKEFSITDSAAPIRDRNGAIIGAVLVFSDCSATRAMARQLNWQATHDPLTGLANRRRFEDRTRVALDSARGQKLEHVLMYLDLDQFKVVNDTCGHVAGDELLKQLSTLLRARVRDIDTLARLGGDEYGVLLYGCPSESGLRIAETLREVVRNFRFVWNSKSFELGVSIGFVQIDAESASVAGILSAADIACHLAKEAGRNRVHVYSKSDAETALRHGEMQWVSKITRALAEDRFVLYCQSIVPATGTDNINEHVEILVRMIDEEGRIVPPGAFIPAAERYNLMGEIDRWVVRNVFRRFNGRIPMPQDDDPPTCSINLSGASMGDKSLLRFIRAQFEQYDIPPRAICFEITETAAVQNLANATQFIKDLSSMGCRFALDDFGAGLSSFAYLKNLPADYLKIDGGFVKDMLHDSMNRAIVEACAQIGKVLGLGTIAEFVKDEETLAALAEIGVDYAQGYGIARPVPLDEIFAPRALLEVAQLKSA